MGFFVLELNNLGFLCFSVKSMLWLIRIYIDLFFYFYITLLWYCSVLFFLFNVGPGFFLRNVGEICTMLVEIKNCRKVIFRRHCTGFFSCTMLPGVPWTTLHKVFTCAMLPKSIKTTLNRTFSCALLSWVSWTTLHKAFEVSCEMLS